MKKILYLLLLLPTITFSQEEADKADLKSAIDQLRHAVGEWQVVTTFLKRDGSVDRRTEGTYTFEWVIPDRLLSGTSNIPSMNMKSGLLFYINETSSTIEMVSVGQDGKLWVMTGPLGGEVRYTQKYETPDGREGQLRFTRFNVTQDQFESKMAYSFDDGMTWTQGNHQLFKRKK